MTTFDNKLVAVLNKKVESGVVMNALAHATIGLGSTLSSEKLRLDTYSDADQNSYPHISQMPFIILKAKSGEIRKTVNTAREQNIKYTTFLNTMTGGTYLEQLENTAKTKEEELQYYGCVLYGPWDQVTDITRKFSLWT